MTVISGTILEGGGIPSLIDRLAKMTPFHRIQTVSLLLLLAKETHSHRRVRVSLVHIYFLFILKLFKPWNQDRRGN